MGVIPRGDLAQNLGGQVGLGRYLSVCLFVVLGLRPLRALLGDLEKAGRWSMRKDPLGQAEQATFFSWTKVNSMSVRLEISSSYLGVRKKRREEGEREAVQLDVVGAWGLVNPPWVWIRASAVSSFGTLCQSEKSGPSFGWIEPLSSMTQALSPMVPQCWLWGNRQTCSLS